MTDNDLMKFGKHEGVALANVPASYFLWCLESGTARGELKQYIIENKSVLLMEVRQERKKGMQKKNRLMIKETE